jgi:glycosyltransferase involved in cell wall biosynthesis
MNNMPLVSVITIFLNEEKFIQEAIESVLAQTYDNWEHLLVDDGSTDKSANIAQRYAHQWPEKVRYLEHAGHQNLGMSASRNLGIRHARGKYIAFLDADDVYLPHKLEQQVTIMETHPDAMLVCGRAVWWYSWTGNPTDKQRDFLQKLDVSLNTVVEPPEVLILFLQDEWASLHGFLVRREAIEAVGGYEESFHGIYEDQVFHAKLCLKYPVFLSSECWFRYRQHPSSCTALSHDAGKHHAARNAFLSWLEEYQSQRGLKDTEVWKVLQSEMRPFRHPTLSRISSRVQRVAHWMKQL